jgi:Spy/CpxP family protein refolding chaperone
MKRFLVSMLASAVLLFNLAYLPAAHASLLRPSASPLLAVEEATTAVESAATAVADTAADLFKQLESEVLPQIESTLTPEQLDDFNTAMTDGKSFRKAFKSLTLTPDQKTKLSDIFKTLPKKTAFSTLTPEQKKQLFMKKKDMFMPTPEEIGEKIKAGMKAATDPDKGGFAPDVDAITEKISAGMKKAEAFMKEKASE